ncbi:MAG: V-type ATP synthase subunit I [Halorientalis sp.]
MLRPERMSRVSVTGSKGVMDDVIETVYDLNLLHVNDYDGSWDGFEIGDPVAGAENASQKLVTVRSLKSILGVDETDIGPNQLVTDEALDEELETVRRDVNELDDERNELEDELRAVEEQIDSVAPYAQLGIDLDLLSGYDSLVVAVGEGDAAGIESELDAAEEVAEFMVQSADDAVAIFVYPDGDTENLDVADLLVGTQFQRYEIPEAEGSPEEYISDLRHRKQQLESKLETVEDELEDLRLDVGGFLLAAEEKLTIEVQKAEAPLSFATTENAFVGEGWIPTSKYDTLAAALETAAGDHVDVEELERADYDSDGHVANREPVETGGQSPGEPGDATAVDGGDAEARADGGMVTMGAESPPVIQDNPGLVRPFEALVGVINRPKYTEFDPTFFVFLTFPVFFGLMVADVGYGLAYMVAGFALYAKSDSEVLSSLGAIGAISGLFTALFGFFAGEIFGLETITKVFWNGSPLLHKGLRPAFIEWAYVWLTISVVVGILHVTLGHVLNFLEEVEHDPVEAVTESGSWILMTVGLWVWVFSTSLSGVKPDFLYTVFAGQPLPFGFAGFGATVGLAGIGGFVVGIVLLVLGEPMEVVEFLQVLVNVLSYTRLAAEVLAEAGIAFVVDLLFFGAYAHEGEFHLLISHGPHHVETLNEASLMFPGLMHMGVLGVVFGLVVLVFGHALVFGLGILSAGMQAVRLEYVEFFGKFYEGGGKPFTPFGYDREYSVED